MSENSRLFLNIPVCFWKILPYITTWTNSCCIVRRQVEGRNFCSFSSCLSYETKNTKRYAFPMKSERPFRIIRATRNRKEIWKKKTLKMPFVILCRFFIYNTKKRSNYRPCPASCILRNLNVLHNGWPGRILPLNSFFFVSFTGAGAAFALGRLIDFCLGFVNLP